MIKQSSSNTLERVAVLTSAYDLGQSQIMDVITDEWTTRHRVAVKFVGGNAASHLCQISATRSLDPDFVYLNSFFHPVFSIFPVLLARMRWWNRAKLVLAPRGELDPGALTHKRFKKQLFLRVSRLAKLHRKVTWHASTEAEAANIRLIFPAADIVVRENETLLPTEALPFVAPTTERRIAFLSRISHKKGLHRLLEALTHVETPLCLDIYGEAEDKGYAARCKDLAAKSPSHINVRFLGALPHSQVLATMRNYDLMALPTAGENFGHAIVESLCSGCPVMLPDSTPWTDAAISTGTLVRGTEPKRWVTALNDYAALDADSVLRRKQLAQQAYLTWRSSQVDQPTILDLLLEPRRPQKRT